MRLDIEVRSSSPGLLRSAGPLVLARATWPAWRLPLYYAFILWGAVERKALPGSGVAVIIRMEW